MPLLARPATVVFVASFLGLFLELALIRWVASEVRVFAYCKNLVLVATFLGFGVGCLLWRRRVDLARAFFLLLLLALVIRLPWQSLIDYGPRRVTAVLAELSGFMIFHHSEEALPWGTFGKLAFAVGWTALLFFVVALVILPFGQLTARGMSALGRPLRGYSINVAGSLLGILAYTFATTLGMPPLAWFVPVVLAGLWLIDDARERQATIGIAVGLLLVLLPHASPQLRELWSSYQKLGVLNDQVIVVNNTGYQVMRPQPALPADGRVPVDRWTMPYVLRRPPGRVLIVGAGSGNDAAAALQAGASAVVAVEIDRAIYELGRRLHPQAPYDDARVRVVIDDARHYLKTTDDRFDLVVFSHLDAHTVLSSFTNVRLDNYIYTVEAFREARARLAPGGILYVSFFSELPFIGERLGRNLSEAFGYPPIALEGSGGQEIGRGWRNIYFLAAERETLARLAPAAAGWSGIAPVRYGQRVVPSTDDWPFLPLERRQVPPMIALISLIILALSVVFVLRARPAGEAFDGRLFWLGAAFMLVEVHNVSRLALLFGTTWQVNAWVIGTILGLILLANAVCAALQKRGLEPGGWASVGLFASLAAAYFVPIDVFTRMPAVVSGLAATALLCAPIFFAGLVFAQAFSKSVAPGFALGWNVLGAVTGGMAESLSYVWGVPSLVPLAALFYVAALAWPRLASATRRVQPSGAAATT